ncbi:MAG: hypothetical protein H0T15_01290, partial [Thermoleophilaceae bacterium]|nr:hypothetical protein [Thermoleophilaceae bacterium]
DMKELLEVDLEKLRAELPQVREHLDRFGEDLPSAIRSQFQALQQRLG